MHETIDLGIQFMIQIEQAGIADCSKEEWNIIDAKMNEKWDTILASIRKLFRDILGVAPP